MGSVIEASPRNSLLTLRTFRAAPLPVRAEIVALVVASLVTFVEVARGLAVGALAGELLMMALGYAALFLLPLGAALSVLRGHRLAHLSAMASSLLLLGLTGGFLLAVLADPGLPYWPSVYASTCALAAAAAFAVLGEMHARAASADRATRLRVSSATGHVAALFLGLAVGGLVVGLVAGGTIALLLSGSGPERADVVIAHGSHDPNFPEPYQPTRLVVSLAGGASVTWYNADTEAHTVTADDWSFDSGLIAPGGSWTHAFTASGIFSYHCRPHPWMKGMVAVEA